MSSSTIYQERDNRNLLTVRHYNPRSEFEVFSVWVTLLDEDLDDSSKFTALSRTEAVALRNALNTALEV